MSRILRGFTLRGFALLAVALLLATALVACGGDDDDDDTTGGGDTQATQQTSPTASSDDQADDDDGGGIDLSDIESGSGTFTIDGEQFDAQLVIRCEPFDASDFGGAPPSEDDFDFVATADRQGTNVVQGEVSFEEVSSFSDPEKSYTAIHFAPFASRSGDSGTEQFEGSAVTDPDGNWYTSLIPQLVIEGQPPDGELLEPPAGIEVDGNHIVGALTLEQSWPQDATGMVDISFDLDLPSEMIDCSTR